jgi:hypothetical protein
MKFIFKKTLSYVNNVPGIIPEYKFISYLFCQQYAYIYVTYIDVASLNMGHTWNLGGRPRVGHGLGFRRRPGFGGPEPTQSMHVDLICVSMCDGGLGDAIARSPVWPSTDTYGLVPADLEVETPTSVSPGGILW